MVSWEHNFWTFPEFFLGILVVKVYLELSQFLLNISLSLLSVLCTKQYACDHFNQYRTLVPARYVMENFNWRKFPQNSELKFRAEFPSWNSGLKFRAEIPSWNSELKFWAEIPSWNSELKYFRLKISAPFPSWKFRLKNISARNFSSEILSRNFQPEKGAEIPSWKFQLGMEFRLADV